MEMDPTNRKETEASLRRKEAQLARLSGCFLGFGRDPDRNISAVVALCGELLGGCCALYNRLGGGKLCSAGQWQVPAGYNPEDKPEGHICYDVIRRGGKEPLVVRNLQQTHYARTDPNVSAYGLQTYIGQPVRCGEQYVGSLCVVYQQDFEPRAEHLSLLGILASAIGIEEERRKAAEELREGEQRLGTMLRAIGDHISMLDRDLNILWANDVAKRVFGEDLIGRKCYEVYHHRTEPCEPHPCPTLRAFQDGKVHEHDTQVANKDGNAVCFHCTANVALRDGEGNPTAVLEVSRDTTEDRRREEQLMIYRAMVESAHDAIFFKDLQGRYLLANAKTLEAFGLPVQQVLGKNDYELLASEEEARRNVEDDQQVFKTGQPAVITKRMTGADGRAYYFEAVKVAQFDREGKVKGLVGIARNVTAQKEAEAQLVGYQDQLRSLAAQLASAEERERRLLAADLHDHIGQALAVAKIKLSGARRQAKNSPLRRPVDEVLQLVEQMIEDTRSLSFQLSPPLLHELGLREAVEWLVEQFRERHQLAIDLEASGSVEGLDGDAAGLLFRGVRELLMNVVRHAKAGRARVAVRGDGPWVRVEVQDDGAGFEVSKAAPRQGASGFGLFSLRERLSHMGGRLEIESAPGRGTRVALLAPAGRKAPADRG